MSNTISINSNISALRAQRQLRAAADSLSSSFEKLSSGLRINKGSDDAAGLAVASSLKADTRIFSQGLRNLNDGVSALNIADGALENLSSIVIRLQELAEQAANGAVSFKQRESLNAEAQALADEYFRISRTASFNGLKLLDGSVQGLALQMGYGSSGSIVSSLGGDLGTGAFSSSVNQYTTEGVFSYTVALADLNSDGMADMVTGGLAGSGKITVRLGMGDGTFSSSVCQYTGEIGGTNTISLADLNGDGVLDMVSAGGAGNQGYASVRIGIGDGTFSSNVCQYATERFGSNTISLTDLNKDGALDMVTAGFGTTAGSATVRLGAGDGTFSSSIAEYTTEDTSSSALALSDLNGDGALDMVTAGVGAGGQNATVRLGAGDGTFSSSSIHYTTESNLSRALSLADLNGDGALDMVTAGTGAGGQNATVRLGAGDGTFSSSIAQYTTEATSSNALALSDLNGDGILDMMTAGAGAGTGRATIRLGIGDGTFSSNSTQYATDPSESFTLALEDVNRDGVEDLVTAGVFNKATIRLAETRDGIAPLLSFDLSTLAGARQAIPVLRQKLDQLSAQRGEIGAFQSRLLSALTTLGSTVLQYRGAQSRVEDIDVANESANLLRQQIVQQTASSVLAQANQAPALAVRLLQ